MGRGLLVKTLNALMRHLREHGVETRGSVHKQRLKNYGYYHGYKGYRFVGSASKRLQISSFDEVIALNQFDTRLKSLLCPHVMFIETALKNYTLEATLSDAGSSSIDAVFSSRSLHTGIVLGVGTNMPLPWQSVSALEVRSTA